MPLATNYALRTWSKSNNTLNLSSNAAVVCITYEGITNFANLTDF